MISQKIKFIQDSQTNSEILDDVITHWKEEGYTLKSLNNLKK